MRGIPRRSSANFEAGAAEVLRARFPEVPLHLDVRTLERIPRDVELVSAGFPCQDLSQAGKTAGIEGDRSGLVREVFRLLEDNPVPWILLENVPFMLHLAGGRALDVIVGELERLGYAWAYRVLNTMAFGLPQRRERVFLLASRVADPRGVLLVPDAGEPPTRDKPTSYGFYWTEGLRGLGLGLDCVPTLKGGSTIGIPSPPAVLLANGDVVKPDIRDAERLQGFPVNWTKPAARVTRSGHRWKLVGNAVTVPVAKWIGQRLLHPGKYVGFADRPLARGAPWPRAAWNLGEGRYESAASSWPVARPLRPIADFLRFPPAPLSVRGAAGFLSRARTSNLRFPPGFLDAVERHRRLLEAKP